MSPPPRRLADAALGVSNTTPQEVIAVRVDGVFIEEPGTDPIRIPEHGPLKNLHVHRLPEQFKLATIGQVLLRSGGSGGQRFTKADRLGREIRMEVDIDLIPSLQGQESISADPAPNGSFRQETRVFMHTDQAPARYLDYTLSVVTGPTQARQVLASTRVRLELVTLEGFLELVDQGEQARPEGHFDCTRDSAAKRDMTHLEYLASVRWLWQSPDPGLAPLFRKLISRHACIPPYDGAPGVSSVRRQRRARLLQFQNLYHGLDVIDIGHVLVGIEVMPNQDPRPLLNVPRVDFALTWSGDLGSVIAEYVWALFYARTERSGWTLERFINAFASGDDLVGDLDGINLGAIYDPTRSLADNLRPYYAGPVTKRYSTFLTNTKDTSGNLGLPLEPGIVPPQFASQATDFIAEEMVTFAFSVVKLRLTNRYGAAAALLASNPLADAILSVHSPQVQQVTKYFLEFLENGLAAEPP